MTEEQFKKVKYGDILNYITHNGTSVKVRVKCAYYFAGGGRIVADVIDKCEFRDCDAPCNYFNFM